MQSLGQMVGLYGLAVCQVCDGAGHPQDLVVAPGGEAQAVVGGLQQALPPGDPGRRPGRRRTGWTGCVKEL